MSPSHTNTKQQQYKHNPKVDPDLDRDYKERTDLIRKWFEDEEDRQLKELQDRMARVREQFERMEQTRKRAYGDQNMDQDRRDHGDEHG